MLGLILAIAAGCALPTQPNIQSEKVRDLIREASSGASLVRFEDMDVPRSESDMRETVMLNNDKEISEAVGYIETHPDFTSYHLLFAVRKFDPKAYAKLSAETKARVLCSALVNTVMMNDWGGLTLDGLAAKALLDTGRAALPYLRPILDNNDSALLGGSSSATVSEIYNYRRADYAYRYASLILSREPMFDYNPEVRDKAIAGLRQQLDQMGYGDPRAP
jgi:hypothetical protein